MDSPDTLPRLGFIGMGAMGSRMAARLLAAGYEVTVYNRRRERAQLMQQRGARVAAEPRELVAAADIVLSMLADDAAVENVLLWPGGALVDARPGAVFIEMSTVSPSLSRRLHALAQLGGVLMLDAPVSGTTTLAEKGELAMYVGGERAVYERCRSILQVLCRNPQHVGSGGSGAVMKLCAATLLGLGMQALAEALALGLKAGLQRERLVDVLGATPFVSPSQKSKLENVLNRACPPTLPLRLMVREYELILEAARNLMLAMPATVASDGVSRVEFARQMAAGCEQDFSSVVQAMAMLGARGG